MGFKPEKVAELVSRTFNEMIFIHGDVHCDPHAANLFLRKDEATGQLQLVLLDHGLYRQAPAHAAMCMHPCTFLDQAWAGLESCPQAYAQPIPTSIISNRLTPPMYTTLLDYARLDVCHCLHKHWLTVKQAGK